MTCHGVLCYPEKACDPEGLALPQGNDLPALHSLGTGNQANNLRSDPPLLWPRCESASASVAVTLGLGAFAISGWPAILLRAPLAVAVVPVTALLRLA